MGAWEEGGDGEVRGVGTLVVKREKKYLVFNVYLRGL